MKKILLPILSLILAACSSSQTAVTRSAQVTVASLPPTATPIPTPTLHPQFVALQTQVAAAGERFTLASDGTIQDGAKTVPGLSVDKNGVMTLQGSSSQVTISPEDVSFDDENGVSVKGYTLNEATGKWGVEVIKEYPICATENFRDCPVPVEDLFNGNYHRWLETLSQPFDQSKLKDVPFWNLGGLILYDEKTAPNFDDPSTAPFRRDVTIGTVFLEIEGVRYPYIVKPIEFFDKNEPEKNKWVITVDPFGNIETGPDSDDIMYRWGIKIWQEEMNVTPILTNAISASSDLEDPLVKQTFDNNPDMQERFDRFILGDVSALSEPGIVLLTTDGIHVMFR